MNAITGGIHSSTPKLLSDAIFRRIEECSKSFSKILV